MKPAPQTVIRQLQQSPPHEAARLAAAADGPLLTPEMREAALRATSFDPVGMDMRALVQSTPASRANERRIENVYLAFFASGGVSSSSWFGSLAYKTVEWMREEYAHVEALFHFQGDVWEVLTVSEKTPSGLFKRDMNHYRLGRWKLMRLHNLSDAKRRKLYTFARQENRHPRTYRYTSAVSTTPFLRLCTPVITYTPGCGACIPTGPHTVFCVQLIVEMLKTIYAGELGDVDSTALRTDQLYHLLTQRIQMADAILSFETLSIERILADSPTGQ